MLGVTATAAVHAAGFGTDALWGAVCEGHSALRAEKLEGRQEVCHIGAVANIEDVSLPPTLAMADCRNHRLAWMALQDSGFREAVETALSRHGAQRIGLLLGSSTSGIRETEAAYAQRRASGRWPEGFDWTRTHAFGGLTRFVSEAIGVQGPAMVVTTACSSSAKVFLVAQRWIEAGFIDAAVVGGVDSLCLSTLHGFDSLQLLSSEPCRPFDEARNGISIGEAAGFALLEPGAAPLIFAGGGESSDAYHMSSPHPQGRGAVIAMRSALESAGIRPTDIGYINAHGTATPSNDRSEAAALLEVFGAHAVPVSSTKGVTGHTLGAAGIVEAIVCLQALRAQRIPPVTNLLKPDPTLAIDLITTPRDHTFQYALSNSFGFGGSNCALVFARGR